MYSGGACRHRKCCIVHRCQGLPFDCDLLSCVLGLGAARCNDDGYRFADVTDQVARQHVLEERSHVAVAWNTTRNRRQVRRQIGCAHNGDDAIGLCRVTWIDEQEASVGMRATDDESLKRERHLQVGHIAPFAAKETLVLDPREARAQHR